MSRAAPVAALLPPLPQRTPASRAQRAPASRAPGADGPTAARETEPPRFDVSQLRLLPHAQRDAAMEAEETPVQPQLEVGPAEDEYEREADEVADTVMRMPDDAVETGADHLGLRRKCAACEREDTVQRQSVAEAEAETGPPSLTASPAALTSGGTPLSRAVRGFYEERLGRDLSDVRVHGGGPARTLNDSISARAFTYGSHIWLGDGEAGRPSHTLSHELVHVLQQTQPRPTRRAAEDATRAEPSVQRLAQWVPAKGSKFWKPGSTERDKTHNEVVIEVSKANNDILANVPIPNAGEKTIPDSRIPRNEGYADFFRAATNPSSMPGVTLEPASSSTAPSVIPGDAPAQEETAEPATPESAPVAEEAAPPPDAGAPPGAEAGASPPGDATTPPGEPAGGFPDLKIVNIHVRPGSDSLSVYRRGIKIGVNTLKGGASHPAARNMYPRVAADRTLVNVARAPVSIELGELKPGHNVGAREAGAAEQLPRYERGLKRIAGAVNSVDAGDRERTTWTLGTPTRMEADTDLKVPDTLSLTSTKRTFHRQLKLSISGDPGFESDRLYPGRLVFGRDRRDGNRGVWTYVWVPRDERVTAATLPPAEQRHLRTLSTRLDELIRELTASPTRVATRRKPKSTRRARRQVRRLPASRKPRKDSFPATWEADRKAFAREVNALVKADLRSPRGLQLARAMAEAFKAIERDLAGYTAPELSQSATGDLRQIDRMKRMAGPLGKLLGELRKRFGTLFVKAANAFDDFRQKLDERVKRPRGARVSGSLGGWRRAVFVVLLAAVTEALQLLAADVARRFAACLDGMSTRLLMQLKEQLEAELAAEIETVRRELMPVIDGFEEVRSRLEKDIEPWFEPLDDLDAFLDEFEEIQPLLNGIEVVVRGLILAAGCSGAGIGCVAGAVGQLAVAEFIQWGAGTDWFREAVIVPIVSDLVEPIGATMYGELIALLFGAKDATTVHGRLSAFATATPECKVPGPEEALASSGFTGRFGPRTPAERSDLIRQGLGEYARAHADELKAKIAKQLRNPEGQPVTPDQVDGVIEAVEDSGLTQEQVRDAMKAARGPDGKVDLGRLQDELTRQRASRGSVPDEGTQPEPPLRLETTIPGPGGLGPKPGPRVRVGPTIVPPDQRGGPAAPGVGVRIEF